jgi:hypothetical protein
MRGGPATPVDLGTQADQLLASRDAGNRGDAIFGWLPPVRSLEAVISSVPLLP